MSGSTRVKLALAALAFVLFIVGARQENTAFRWAAIGLLAAAFLLRFHRPRA